MLTLNMIVRNAEDTVIRAIDSAMPFVDAAVIVMAGHSTDGTADVISRYAAESEKPVHIVQFMPENFPDAFFDDGALSDFAAARNEALKYVAASSHWLFLDSDDELTYGEHLADCVKLLDDKAGVIALTYNYSHNQYGRPNLVQNKERVYSGRITDWQWRDRVHEWCHTAQDAPYAFLEKPVVEHHREPDDARTDRNTRILQLMLEEDPKNRRAVLHLAESYYASKQWELALDLYVKVHQNPEIEPHAYHAALQAAKCAIALQDYPVAAQWSMIAVDMRPIFKDGYLLRAQVAADMEDWEATLVWLDLAADKVENTKGTAISVWEDDYKWNPWNAQFAALFQLQRFTEAIAVARVALHEYPGSAFWARKLSVAEEGERMEKSIMAYQQIADHFVRRGDTINALAILQDQLLPMTIRQDNRIIALRRQLQEATAHVFDPERYKKFYTSDTLGHEINGTAIDRYRLEPIVASLKKRKAKRILEVGTGAGGPAIWMLKQLPDVVEYVGLDINPDLVEMANKAAEFHGVADRLRFEQGSLAEYMMRNPSYCGGMGMLNAREPYFDAVLLLEIIEHMQMKDAQILLTNGEEIAQAVLVTTPGMFCSDIPPLNGPMAMYPRDHVKEYSMSDLEQMIFKVPRRRPVNLFKAYAPEADPEWTRIMPDGIETQHLDYVFPGFANWYMEFDNVSRHQGPVVIYCGAGPGWSPLDLATKGLGGAETMAVKVAEQFAANNHPVIVYGDWTGILNGVIYRHYTQFNPEKPYGGVDAWLFIASRIPAVFDDHINADIKWLWEHDVDAGSAEMTDARLEQIDRILLLSEWHKQHWLEVYPNTPVEKIAVTRNAVDPADFPNLLSLNGDKEKLERRRHRFVWPSSPDRGLDVVLDWWPAIREMWPDAELHVFYGFDTIDAMSHLPGRQWLPLFKRKILDMANQPGVFLRGRVNQTTLHDEMAKAQFWLYPSKTAFEWAWNETYCIAAVEAMAMGVTPIVADTGALRERLEDFGLADGLVVWGSPRKAWIKALKAHDVMPNEMELARRRDVMELLSFENLYAEWMRLLMETSIADNRSGRHNFAVVSQTA